ncbi:transposase [Nostoc sp.]|uniref:transposase n=1 Tax=Nostoc sp. TaxID=1180 RepID=UPI002FFB9CDA
MIYQFHNLVSKYLYLLCLTGLFQCALAQPTLYEEQKGFVVLPKRWLVERTFGWFNWCRRLSKDYEILPQTTEAFIYVAIIRLMLKQLA